MYVGVDYYPEHWPKTRWATDAKLMQEAGFNVVRLAEFAWVFCEPEEGRFDFTWLDEALATLAARGISVILGTPTAVMPAWCARKYPETLLMQRDGTRVLWGMRKNNCFTSGTYRLLSERITQAMATHFASAPNVIGWQTDNEFGGPFCVCETCRVEFQEWLRRKYGTLGELNRAWGTHFWGHLYHEWAEILIPTEAGAHNPSAGLDWQRFGTWLNVRFQHDQVKILRATCPKQFVTHNLMGFAPELNYFDLAADLDHVSWDNYPVWGAPGIRYGSSAAADLMRGLKQRNFWIMEQTAGPCGWGSFTRNPRPGEIRGIAYQQLAHGADHTVWFRWRTCTAGREQYWHGLLGHDGRPLRRYREAAQTASEFHRLAPVLEGTTTAAQVAILYDYDSLWATRLQPGFNGNDHVNRVERYYRALFRAGVGADLLAASADWSQYPVVIAPNLYLLPDTLAERLVAYVRAGGVLLTDARTGVKDASSLCHDRTLPGLLAPALGISIEEYEALDTGLDFALTPSAALPGPYTAQLYADWITPTGAEVLAGYSQWHLKDFAAVTRHRHGQGWGYYAGTLGKEEAFYDALLAAVLQSARVQPAFAPPPGIEAVVRAGAGRRLLFLINHLDTAQTLAVPAGLPNLLTGTATGASLTLAPYDVAVIQLAS